MHDDVSRELVVARPDDEYVVRMAVTGFLAGYSGLTRDAYALDLRSFWRWCTDHGLGLFSVRRTHIELFARWLEQEGKAKATVARRLSTISMFYRFCEQEQLIEHSPAVHVRRPKLSYESNAVGLDRNELGALLVQAGLAGGRDHALLCLLALNGLRTGARRITPSGLPSARRLPQRRSGSRRRTRCRR